MGFASLNPSYDSNNKAVGFNRQRIFISIDDSGSVVAVHGLFVMARRVDRDATLRVAAIVQAAIGT